MTKEEFLMGLESAMKDCLETARMKNSDYAGGGDPFKNFKNVEVMGISSTEAGILVRMVDKISRAGNLIKKQAEVKDESIHDTLRDLANYALILDQYITSKEKEYESDGKKDTGIDN